jgi:germination protein M
MKRFGIFVVVLALFLAGCSGDGDEPRPDPEPAPEATETDAAPTPAPSEDAIPIEESGRKLPIQLWYVQDVRGEAKLRLHWVELPAVPAIGRAALEALFAGVPDEAPKNTYSIVPEETELLDLSITKSVATVDLSGEFENTGVGTAADGLQIAQVVYTLTQFPSVKKVRFLIDGQEVVMIGGHGIELEGPQSRKDWETSLPPIVVFRPYAGEEVDVPFTLTGAANVFEATVSWRLKQGPEVLEEGFMTATCGTGCYGTFAQEIDPDVDLPARVVLEVFESSAEDGRPLHMQRIPLLLREP